MPAFPANASGLTNADMDVETADNENAEEKESEALESQSQPSSGNKQNKESEVVIEPPSPRTYATTSISWAPSCGRSFHLIATGSRDGRVRIWKIRPSVPDDSSINSRSRNVFGSGESGSGNGGSGNGGFGYGFAISSGGDHVDVGGADVSMDAGTSKDVSGRGEEDTWNGALVGEFDDHKYVSDSYLVSFLQLTTFTPLPTDITDSQLLRPLGTSLVPHFPPQVTMDVSDFSNKQLEVSGDPLAYSV